MLDLNNTSDVFICSYLSLLLLKESTIHMIHFTEYLYIDSIKVNGMMSLFSICPYSYKVSENQINILTWNIFTIKLLLKYSIHV